MRQAAISRATTPTRAEPLVPSQSFSLSDRVFSRDTGDTGTVVRLKKQVHVEPLIVVDWDDDPTDTDYYRVEDLERVA